jgi:hypothetical protein
VSSLKKQVSLRTSREKVRSQWDNIIEMKTTWMTQTPSEIADTMTTDEMWIQRKTLMEWESQTRLIREMNSKINLGQKTTHNHTETTTRKIELEQNS